MAVTRALRAAQAKVLVDEGMTVVKVDVKVVVVVDDVVVREKEVEPDVVVVGDVTVVREVDSEVEVRVVGSRVTVVAVVEVARTRVLVNVLVPQFFLGGNAL